MPSVRPNGQPSPIVLFNAVAPTCGTGWARPRRFRCVMLRKSLMGCPRNIELCLIASTIWRGGWCRGVNRLAMLSGRGATGRHWRLCAVLCRLRQRRWRPWSAKVCGMVSAIATGQLGAMVSVIARVKSPPRMPQDRSQKHYWTRRWRSPMSMIRATVPRRPISIREWWCSGGSKPILIASANACVSWWLWLSSYVIAAIRN